MDSRQFSAFPAAAPGPQPVRKTLLSPAPRARRLGVLALAASVILMAACTPALNWRQVQLQELRAQLPCKPDQATRTVSLAGEAVSLEMAGCQADGALFAVSRVETNDAAAAGRVMAAWKTQALAALKATDVKPASMRIPPWANAHATLQASGKNPDGKPTQAQLTWLVREGRVYHLAVYAEQLNDSMTHPFLEDLQIP